ncbi:MAG: precorrin-6A synthase (deacetylating) [Nocardioides sp.]|uniref:precorrin-6A synthase (deacetylating) n=1 Tax=Nocardioides sp. TaxID=35761 RepID=UPI0039E47287
MRVRILGIGMGPQHVTPEVAEALRGCDYVVAASKSADDGLLAIRRAICEAYDVELVPVPDPERDRADPADYPGTVRAWHDARVVAYRAVIEERGGTAGFLVWGDPSLYDSTIRIVSQLGVEFDVLPGIAAPQLLAAAHRVVLHGVGRPVVVTTERRLPEAVAAGAENVVVMLTSGFDPAGVEDWQVWWGANLGTSSARLVSGRAGDVAETIREMRAEAKAEAGWVMDLYLLRRVP